MAPSVPVGIPTPLRAGDTWKWTQSFGDFPISESWVISYHLRGVSRLTWDATWVTDDGSIWTIEVPAATTVDILAGRYTYTARVTDGSETYTAEQGFINIETDLAAAAAASQQTHAERMVDILETELESRLTGSGSAHEGYMVAGRQIQKIPILDLKNLLGRYRADLQRQRNPGQFNQNIRTRFVCP